MPRLMRQITTPITLAAYLLAFVAAALHHHAHSHAEMAGVEIAGHCHAGHCHAGHGHGGLGHCHSHAAGETDHPGHHHHSHGGSPHHHHEDCAVCQFLALKTVSTPLVTIAGLVETVKLAEPHSTVQCDAPSLPLPPSRGPPSATEV